MFKRHFVCQIHKQVKKLDYTFLGETILSQKTLFRSTSIYLTAHWFPNINIKGI